MTRKRRPGQALTPEEERLRNKAIHVAIASEDIQGLRNEWLNVDRKMYEIRALFQEMQFVRHEIAPSGGLGTPEFLNYLDAHSFLVAMCIRLTGEACQVDARPGVFTKIANTLLEIWADFHRQDEEHRAQLAKLGLSIPASAELVNQDYRLWRNEPLDGK
jgi:hypothetical protein